ncbi:MAG: hypothetical protein JXX14_17245 [Deltaproteobacteria bacterium]|nr:hypothetical protein [Deltaproteobacteria bacterium]
MNTNRITDRLKHKLAKHKSTLPKFLFIGVVKTFSAIFFNWIFIDLLKMEALLGASIAYFLVFIGTYIAYVLSKTIHKGFIKYTVVVAVFNGLAIAMVTVMVKYGGMAGFSSSSITTAVLVLLRYLVLHKFGIINTGDATPPASASADSGNDNDHKL